MIVNCERAPRRRGILMLLSALVVGIVALSSNLSSTKPSSLATESSAASFDLAALEPVDRLGGHTTAVAISGTRAAVGVGRRVALVDLSGPEELALLDHGPIVGEPSPSVPTGSVLDVTVHDLLWHENTVVAAAGARGLAVVDASAGGGARVTGRVPTASPAWRVAAGPGEVGSPLWQVPGLQDPKRMAVAGQRVLVAGSGGLQIIDAPIEGPPRIIAEHAWGLTQDVATLGELAVLLLDRELAVFNLSDPEHPNEIGRIALQGQLHNLRIEGNVVYVTVGSQLHAISLADPSRPQLLGALEAPSGPGAVGIMAFEPVAAGHLAAHIFEFGKRPPHYLAMLDARDPSHMAVRGLLDLPGLPTALAVTDGTLLMGSAEGLISIDPSQPDFPDQDASLSLPESSGPTALLVDGARLIVAGSGLTLLAPRGEPGRVWLPWVGRGVW